MGGINIASVQFQTAGRTFDYSYTDLALRVGDSVVVETERGLCMAEVVKLDFWLDSGHAAEKRLKPLLRKATANETRGSERLTDEYVSEYTRKLVSTSKLAMKVLKSVVQFGGAKVIIYFSAPGRVDFRELVKKIAGGLRTRVELKQIGARDETKLLGGVGICGREYCCSSFLRDFVPVSIRMAKNQNLALNPTKVSGGCGRLLCCLTYENEVYTELRQQLPPRGAMVRVKSQEVTAKVLRSDLLNQTVQLETESAEIITAKISDIESDKSSEDPGQLGDALGLSEWGEDLDLQQLAAYTGN